MASKLEIRRMRRTLGAIDTQLMVDPLRAGIVDLRRLVEQIADAIDGEIRIVANGVRSALKSTTIELLLGQAVSLNRGSHAVTAVATEIRLVPAECEIPGHGEVLMLSERGARHRIGQVADQAVRERPGSPNQGGGNGVRPRGLLPAERLRSPRRGARR